MSAKARAKKIKLLLLDVDGVMTDGHIFVLPAPAGVKAEPGAEAAGLADAGGYAISSDTMMEAKGFHAHDGTAISLARLVGLKTGVITKRLSRTVRLRAGCGWTIYQGVADKLTALEEILAKEGLKPAQAAYVGDDIIDLPVMRRCGLAIAVPNARKEVKAVAHYVTRHGGGKGAVRDAVEYILRAQGSLENSPRHLRRQSCQGPSRRARHPKEGRRRWGGAGHRFQMITRRLPGRPVGIDGSGKVLRPALFLADPIPIVGRHLSGRVAARFTSAG
jgi:3-deoxy-D-manno-octulosonate 8-phosphate phosphatase (KDO 8-P phosphatase)